jgi:hypothetical protein
MKENGVMERIRHFRAPKMRISILSTVCVSKIKPPSPCFQTDEEKKKRRNINITLLNIWFTLQWHVDLPGKKRRKTLFSSSWQLEKRRRWQEAL